MFKTVFLIVSALALAGAQVPSLGWCPEYVPMANFDMSRFLGVWYEAERYFQLSEVVSRCVMANYTKGPDGKLRVSNEVTNRFTGIKRILEGEIKPAASRSEEGKLHVKYTTFPLTPETNYAVLETDYKNYAVLWSCQGIGPVNAQNAWLMTRSRRPAAEVLQMAYGVLDKYKISKTFFVKTDQADCAYLDTIAETDKPDYSGQAPAEDATPNDLRSAIVPDTAEVIIQTRKAETAEKPQAAKPIEPVKTEEIAKPESQPIKAEEVILKTMPIEKEIPAPVEIKAEEEQQKSLAVTVPEAILKAASDAGKEAPVAALQEKHVEPAPASPLEKPGQSTDLLSIAAQDQQQKQASPAEAPKEEEKKSDSIKS